MEQGKNAAEMTTLPYLLNQELGSKQGLYPRPTFDFSDHGVAGQPVASMQTLNRKKLIQCSQTASFGPRSQAVQTT